MSATGLLILSRLTEGSSLLLVMPALVLHSSGMGVFYSPNTSSVLSTVERESYGIVSALLNLVRNAGNVTSVAVATAIVTATMGAMGFEPSLNAVQGGGDSEVSQAFTSGLRIAFMTMAGTGPEPLAGQTQYPFMSSIRLTILRLAATKTGDTAAITPEPPAISPKTADEAE
jgi:hypothetical protein